MVEIIQRVGRRKQHPWLTGRFALDHKMNLGHSERFSLRGYDIDLARFAGFRIDIMRRLAHPELRPPQSGCYAHFERVTLFNKPLCNSITH